MAIGVRSIYSAWEIGKLGSDLNGAYLESIYKVGFQRMIQSLLKGAHPVGRLCQPPAQHLRRFTETPYSKAPFSLFKLMTL